MAVHASSGTRLGLGTVQFGIPYGITNAAGQVPLDEAARILLRASEAGVRVLDTAALYGSSETVLGQLANHLPADMRIITKTPAVTEPTVTLDHCRLLRETFHRSLDRLGRTSVDGLLVHHGRNLLLPRGSMLIEEMMQLKAEGQVSKIGVSVYEGEELDSILRVFRPDIVQLPLNVVDQRLVHSGHLERLRELGVEVHARSLFLQGLLLQPPESLPRCFSHYAAHWQRWQTAAADAGLSPIAACLGFGLSRWELDHLIVGVTSVAELETILTAAGEAAQVDFDYAPFALDDTLLLNPANWPSC